MTDRRQKAAVKLTRYARRIFIDCRLIVRMKEIASFVFIRMRFRLDDRSHIMVIMTQMKLIVQYVFYGNIGTQ